MYFVGRTFCDDREYEVRFWTEDFIVELCTKPYRSILINL